VYSQWPKDKACLDITIIYVTYIYVMLSPRYDSYKYNYCALMYDLLVFYFQFFSRFCVMRLTKHDNRHLLYMRNVSFVVGGNINSSS
jgi:hypothetical protein